MDPWYHPPWLTASRTADLGPLPALSLTPGLPRTELDSRLPVTMRGAGVKGGEGGAHLHTLVGLDTVFPNSEKERGL